ncbi:MAG: thiamine pyrophosphate-binding protein [bacterium]|nr:thiamine pyrophosphate-binding protein [bacterium]
MNRLNGAGLFLETLIDEGVNTMFGNPGTTELGLMDAMVNEKRLNYYLCLQEGVASAAAEGYAVASGGIGVINLHVAPGLGNAMGNLYNSKRAGTPLLVTAGNWSQAGQFYEVTLFDDLTRIAEPHVKWSFEVRRLVDLEAAVRRAIKVALTPPTGPVFLSLPGDIMLEAAEGLQGKPTRLDPRFSASAASIRQAAETLAAAKRPIIVAGSRVTRSGAEPELVRLAELTGAKVYGETFPNTIAFPMDHPQYAGELGRFAKPVRRVFEGADAIFLVGTEAFIFSYPPDLYPIPDGAKVLHLDQNPWEIGKNIPTDIALYGDPKATLPALIEEVEGRMDEAAHGRARTRREEIEKEVAGVREKETPRRAPENEKGMNLVTFHAALGEGLPKETFIVDEAITAAGSAFRRAITGKASHLIGIKGGGIGMGLPQTVGVKAALPDRSVVGVVGDGSAMYTIQALYTAAKYDLGAVFVIANNASYRILKQRVLALDGKSKEFGQFVAMDIPELDFPKLAESMGMAGRRVATADDFVDTLREATQNGKPFLIDAAIFEEGEAHGLVP